jgi:hypothetical protein
VEREKYLAKHGIINGYKNMEWTFEIQEQGGINYEIGNTF